MLFTSFEFLIFLTAVFALWRLVPEAGKGLVLLGGSYVFCGWWQPWFLLVLGFCTLVSWVAGRFMARVLDVKQRKWVLIGAVVVNLVPLLFFKYANFFNESLYGVLAFGGWPYSAPRLDLLLPLGISFYTFQAVSYCADVYRGRVAADSGLVSFALYMSFFPRLVSGPIERAGNLLPQLTRANRFSSQLFASGVRLFMWGVFKKVVIADRMGMYVDMVFADPGVMAGKTALLGAWMFSLQIYCDFSAYMDMAVGCGRMFGIELSRNFNFPYMARSIGDFWRRWHITLTSWFRDYVYIPLGGNQVGDRKWVRNILAVFLLSGLWHGAAWTFVFWGGLHGAFYLAGRYTGRIRDRVRRAVGLSGNPAAVWQVVVTFQLVSLAWVFFRAETIGGAFSLIRNMFVQWDLPVRMMASQFSTALAFAAAVGFIGIEVVSFWAAKKQIDVVGVMPAVIRYPGYAVLLIGISLLGVSSNQFIYFQF